MLSEAQKKAVFHDNGPALVLSGPGSGKTTVIIHRTAFLLKDKCIASERLLSVTFSRAAGLEMSSRFKENFKDYNIPQFSTVHSFCNSVILKYERNFKVKYIRIEGEEQGQKKKIIGDIFTEINSTKLNPGELDKLAGWVSRYANKKDSMLAIDFEPQVRKFNEIYEKYVNYKKNNMLIDFDDMIILAKNLLRNFSKIKEYWSNRYDYVQVDEGQDLSIAQFEVMKIIARNENIFVVADDDQGIYGFRGADPKNVVNFDELYPNCRIYKLEENYRSCSSIVDAASAVVGINSTRYQKDLYTKNEAGKKPIFRYFSNCWDQAKFIYDETQRLSKAGMKSIGILYRNNLSALILCLFLKSKEYGYNISSDMVNPNNNWMVREILVAIKKAESECMLIIPSPKSVLGRKLELGFLKRAKEFCNITGQQPSYADCWLDFIKELCRISNSYDDIICILNNFNSKQDIDSCIHLSTIHSAKGLEYDAVFIIDLVNGEFPGSGSMTGSLLEEERRIFYVGMTRAKKLLYLLRPIKRGETIEEESIFFKEAKTQVKKLVHKVI